MNTALIIFYICASFTESITGIFTGSVYKDPDLFDGGFLGENTTFSSGETFVIKSHRRIRDSFTKPGRTFFQDQAQKKVLLLVRNPFLALISFRHLIVSGLHTGRGVGRNTFQGLSWDWFVKTNIKFWENLAVSSVRDADSLHVVMYEHLTRHRNVTVMNMAGFLGVGVTQQRFLCLNRHAKGQFARDHGFTGQKKAFPFTATQTATVGKAICRVNKLLESRKDLLKLPLHSYVQDIRSEFVVPDNFSLGYCD